MKRFGAEIYIKDKPEGQTGWDIKFIDVLAETKKEAKAILESWPLFDVVIFWDYAIETTDQSDGIVYGLTGHRGEQFEVLHRSNQAS